ncbi:MAG TPA: hypothetical protein VH559_06820 [Gemmatimonadaceae bacterium]
MRYSVNHDGVPVGFVELPEGELVAGKLAPVAGLEAFRPTIRAGSDALLALGFFGAASGVALNGAGTALRAAADLRFDLVDVDGGVVHANFVNLIESPDGGVVVIARFRDAHATEPALVPRPLQADSGHADAPDAPPS